MKWHVIWITGCLMLAAALSAGWWHTRAPDVAELKRAALEHRQRGDLTGFVAVLDQIPDDSPDKARAYLEQGRAFWELNLAVSMEQVLELCLAREARRAAPSMESIGAWGTLGDHYIGQERFEEAREVIWKVFDAGARQGRPDPFYLSLLLRMRYESAEPAIAFEKLRKFVANDPDDFDSHRALGIYLSRTGELEEAREHLQLAFDAHPRLPRFLDSWLSFLFHVGEWERAAAVLEQLPAECENRPEFLVYRGKAAEARGDPRKAIEHYSNALELEPHRIDANNLLAQALRRTGDIQAFEAQLARCRELGEAYRELAEQYDAIRQLGSAPLDPATCRRIAKLSRDLGWEREAQGWESVSRAL